MRERENKRIEHAWAGVLQGGLHSECIIGLVIHQSVNIDACVNNDVRQDLPPFSICIPAREIYNRHHTSSSPPFSAPTSQPGT